MIDKYTKKIITYCEKRETTLANKRRLIDSLIHNNDIGPERRAFETSKATEIAKLDNELWYIDETLTWFHDRQDSFRNLKREANKTPVK